MNIIPVCVFLGAYGAAVLYKKKDDDSLVILKEINMHDLKATERQMALNEVSGVFSYITGLSLVQKLRESNNSVWC